VSLSSWLRSTRRVSLATIRRTFFGIVIISRVQQ
jgi:hypothetical protein